MLVMWSTGDIFLSERHMKLSTVSVDAPEMVNRLLIEHLGQSMGRRLMRRHKMNKENVP